MQQLVAALFAVVLHHLQHNGVALGALEHCRIVGKVQAVAAFFLSLFLFDISSMLETKKSKKRDQMLNYILSNSCFNSGYCVISPYLALDTASCLSSLSLLSKPK